MSIVAQTPRIIIREFLPEEEDIYLNHFNDELVTQYLPVRSRDERINFFRKALEQYAVNKKLGTWGIFNKVGGEFIGSCLLRPFNTEPGIVEVGYSMERKYWGMGIGTEMATAMVAHGFTDENTSEIVAVTILENIGSQRVLEKAGLKRMDNLMRDGIELAYFKILPGKS
ncbi:MAG: anhydro-N-acetylmuramic acid kinase [Mucilaginibacter sp.]|jgi:ribosomal-protein-alanine N-acetyltransferase|nr:anhydro-N-acetylmuramic acid kinase [Mucilaginibacter sp.]